MKFLAAYLLLSLAGAAPTKESIIKVLSAVGIESDDDRLDKLLTQLDGKDVNELIAEGSSKLASVPSGGAAAAASGAAAAAGGAAATPAEEAKEEEKEESDDDMGFGLFD